MKTPRRCSKCGEELPPYRPSRLCGDCKENLSNPTPEEIEKMKATIREENLAAERARVHHDNWEMSIRDPRVFRLKMD